MNNLADQAAFWWLALATLVAAAGLYVLFRSVALVRGDELAVLERRWLGRRMPEGRVVALRHEVGVQAHILGPGLHFLTPFIYAVTKTKMLEVGEDEVALVEAIDGRPVAPGRIFAAVVAGHNLFQDGEAFLTHGGERGPQLELIPPGIYRTQTRAGSGARVSWPPSWATCWLRSSRPRAGRSARPTRMNYERARRALGALCHTVSRPSA